MMNLVKIFASLEYKALEQDTWSLVGLVEVSLLLSQRGAVEAFHFCTKKSHPHSCFNYGKTQRVV